MSLLLEALATTSSSVIQTKTGQNLSSVELDMMNSGATEETITFMLEQAMTT